MLKKLVFTFMALFLILLGSGILMMGYFFNHPSSIFNAFESFTAKLTEGQSYEEIEEYFLQGLHSVDITADQTNFEIFPYKGSTLKIVLQGKVPQFEKGPFLTQKVEPDALVVEVQEPPPNNWVHININGHNNTLTTDFSMTAKVYLPYNFTKEINIESGSGHIIFHATKEKLYELELTSQTGEIKNNNPPQPTENIKPEEVGKLHLITDSGSITVQ